MTTVPTRVSSIDELIRLALGGGLGRPPADLPVSVALATRQGARHAHRTRGYRNHVISLRVDQAVGSAAVEPDEVADDTVYDCVGSSVGELLTHPLAAIRVAALDAYLMTITPHERSGATAVTIPAGDSYTKSMVRAAGVVELVEVAPRARVLVVGVVNSLLHQLRARNLRYVPCDRKGGRTEWDEPVITDPAAAVDGCDALLVSGMTLANGTFAELLEAARRAGVPLVLFAQTGSAIAPWFVGAGVAAVCAEPYPFFWLSGGPTVVYHYRGGGRR